MWGKVPCDFLFSGARATSCFPSMCGVDILPPSHIISLLLFASLLAPRSSRTVRLSLFLFHAIRVFFGVGGIVGERRKIYACKNTEKAVSLEGGKKTHLWSSWISILKTFTMGVDLSPAWGRLAVYSAVLLVGKSIFIWKAEITNSLDGLFIFFLVVTTQVDTEWKILMI